MQDKQEIIFELTNSNFGSQVLVFNNDDIDVILRNQSKQIRNHNSKKEKIIYKITIERQIKGLQDDK